MKLMRQEAAVNDRRNLHGCSVVGNEEETV